MRALFAAQCSAILRGAQLSELDAHRGGQRPLSPAMVNPLLPVTNPYLPEVPQDVVAELYPVAPKDALAPPGDDGIGIYGPLDRSSINDQMAWRSAFPAETPDPLPGLAGRWLVAQPDRTDVPAPKLSVTPAGPLPGDFGINPPVANAVEDRIPAAFSRYFNQQHHRELAREEEARLEGEMDRVDTDGDGGVVAQEFELEMENRQHRSVADKDALWDKYKDINNVITKTNLKRMAATGYAPLNMVPLPLSTTASESGFWGSQWHCPENQVAVGARLKMAAYVPGQDNTRVNGVELKCAALSSAVAPPPAPNPDDPTANFQSGEGPAGEFTDGACAADSAVDGVRVRYLPYLPTQDNLGITDLVFTCRSRDLVTRANFTFATPAAPPDAPLGGWAGVQHCSTGEYVCSVQTRVDPYGEDKMGLTTVAFGCCGGSADCDKLCQVEHGHTAHDVTAECKACKAALAGQ